MKITADFNRVTGKIRPLHGVGQPPLSLWQETCETHLHYLKEAGIPYSRLHDTGGRYGAGVYVDIPNIFRDFDADENLPESYDFSATDILLANLKKYGAEPFYRLGVTIENDHAVKSYRIFPPKCPEKWARICEHIIRHYNEGWANGFHHHITYWEIWNEPDDCLPRERSSMWHGTKEEYFRLYEVTANHLKKCFGDTIKVGGYASCGFYYMGQGENGTLGHEILQTNPDGTQELLPGIDRSEFFVQFFHEFLQYITSEAHHAPIDFFSWHSYAPVNYTIQMHRYCRRVLAAYGLDGIEDILDEWNTCHDARRGTPFASANVLSMMLGMQKERLAEMNFYDASMGLMGYSGLFNAETQKPHLTYFCFMAFNQLYRLQNEVYSVSDDKNIYVGAATDGKKRILLCTNNQETPAEVELEILGASCADAEILRIDDTYRYSPTGIQIENGKLLLPAWSCTEIRF